MTFHHSTNSDSTFQMQKCSHVLSTSQYIHLLTCNTVGDMLGKNKPSLPVSSFPQRASHRSPSGSLSAAGFRLRPRRAFSLLPPFREQHNRCIQQTAPSGTRSLSEAPVKPPCDEKDFNSATGRLLKKHVYCFYWPVGAARTCPRMKLHDPGGLRAPAGRSLSDAALTEPCAASAWVTTTFRVITSRKTAWNAERCSKMVKAIR